MKNINTFLTYIENYNKKGTYIKWRPQYLAELKEYSQHIADEYQLHDFLNDPMWSNQKIMYINACRRRDIDSDEFFNPLKDEGIQDKSSMMFLLFNIIRQGSDYLKPYVIRPTGWKKEFAEELFASNRCSTQTAVSHIIACLESGAPLYTKEEEVMLRHYFEAVHAYWIVSYNITNEYKTSIQKILEEMYSFKVTMYSDVEFRNSLSRLTEIRDTKKPKQIFQEKWPNEDIRHDLSVLQGSNNPDALLIADVIKGQLADNARRYFFNIKGAVDKIDELIKSKSFNNLSVLEVFEEVPEVGIFCNKITDVANKYNHKIVASFVSRKIYPVTKEKGINLKEEHGSWIIRGQEVPEEIKVEAYNKVLSTYGLKMVPCSLYRGTVINMMKERFPA